jgi:hypothetical protein
MKENPMWKLTGLLCLPLLLSACSERSGAEEAVREGLKDPDSAKFGEFYYNAATKKACLTVNAKNSMGGYTGNQEAELKKGEDGWSVNGMLELDHETCKGGYANAAANSAQNDSNGIEAPDSIDQRWLDKVMGREPGKSNTSGQTE